MITYEEALGIPTTTKPEIQQNPTPTPKQIGIQERREQVMALILQGKDITTIAKQLGVDRSTIYVDFEEWAKTEQAKYIQIEWLQQYEVMKQEDPQTAFEALTKLMMKLLEKQAKVEVNLTQETNILVKAAQYSEEDKNAILSARRAILSRRSSPSEPVSIH